MLSELTSQPCDLLKARAWFKMRGGVNWVVTVILFIPVYFVLMLLFGTIIAFIVSTTTAFALFFFVLDKRAIRIQCPSCQQIIDTNTPWICGNKGCRNDNVDEFPFIYRCQHCGYYPKAYECHHCKSLLFFTDDQQRTGYATCAYQPSTPEPVENNERANEAVELEDEIKMKALKLKEAELDVQLKAYKGKLEPEKAQSIEEKYKTLLKDVDDERRLRAAIDEEFKGDEYERVRRHRIIDVLMRRSL